VRYCLLLRVQMLCLRFFPYNFAHCAGLLQFRNPEETDVSLVVVACVTDQIKHKQKWVQFRILTSDQMTKTSGLCAFVVLWSLHTRNKHDWSIHFFAYHVLILVMFKIL
jgi:uncharacterized membrane protein